MSFTRMLERLENVVLMTMQGLRSHVAECVANGRKFIVENSDH